MSRHSKKVPTFDDGTDARSDFRGRYHDKGRSQGRRKTMQLCAQVRRTIELTLVGDCEDEVLQDLMVESVEPAPDDSRLRVVVSAHGAAAEVAPNEVMTHIEAARGLLQREVMNAISRKKAPELAFELARPES